MESFNEQDIRYLEAKKRVKRLKGFYIHFAIYILVNTFLIANNLKKTNDISNIENYWTAIFWGIGLIGHASSVFLPNFIFGRDWEQRKIKELMDKNK